MTRINASISPGILIDKHLVAEYREISRIGSLVRKRISKESSMNDIPKEFTLGTGHVKFFYDKGLYIVSRWDALVVEMRARGFNAKDVWDTWDGIPAYLMNDWDDSGLAVLSALRERIRGNILRSGATSVRIKGKVLELNEYFENILNK